MRPHRRAHSTPAHRHHPRPTPALISAIAATGILAAASSATAGEATVHGTHVHVVAEYAGTQRHSVARAPGPMLVPAAIPLVRPHAAPTVPTIGPGDPPPVFGDAAPGAAATGIPVHVLAAYRNAELILRQSEPACGVTWNLLAGIGRIESGHARSGDVDAEGRTRSPILGPALNGTLAGNEIIRAANGYVRAVGPMQFLPSTWQRWASDGNGDRIADPDNIYDATLAAGRYLCAGGADLRDPHQRLHAVLRYNHSMAYASSVLNWSSIYAGEVTGPADITPVESTAPTTVPADDDPTPAPPPADPSPPDAMWGPGTSPMPLPEPAPPSPAPMIQIPGLPPIPCGIFCPPPAH